MCFVIGRVRVQKRLSSDLVAIKLSGDFGPELAKKKPEGGSGIRCPCDLGVHGKRTGKKSGKARAPRGARGGRTKKKCPEWHRYKGNGGACDGRGKRERRIKVGGCTIKQEEG